VKKKIDLVILSGGKGRKFKNFLNNRSKPMINFNKINFLQYLLNLYSKYNFKKIYILTDYKSKFIINKYHKKRINFSLVECIKEKKKLGTGGTLSLLPKTINDFVLVNGDSLLDINLDDLILMCKKNYLGVVALVPNKNYKTNQKLNCLRINSKKEINFSKSSPLTNGGVYFFKKKILSKIKKKFISLENEILKDLIKKKKLLGKKYNNFFLDVVSSKNQILTAKQLERYFKRPAAFLDRDGVINHDYGYVYKIKNFKFRSGVLKGLKYLQKKNYYIFIITNQSGIAKKKFTLKDFYKLNKKIKKKIGLLKIYLDDIQYCLYHPQSKILKYKKKSNFRKPGNLMIKKLCKNWLIDLKQSFMIGDNQVDKLCAKKSNLYFEYSKTNFYNQVYKIINKI